MPADIMEYEPKVKCMHIVNFGIGAALQFDAEKRKESCIGDQRIISRMIAAAKRHYDQAQSSLPADTETTKRLQTVNDFILTHKPSGVTFQNTREATGAQRGVDSKKRCMIM